jgi:hypothetical protein
VGVVRKRIGILTGGGDVPGVCTENSNPDVMMVKPAEDRV